MAKKPDGKRALIVVMRYCLLVNKGVTATGLIDQLTRVLGDDAENANEAVMTAGEQLIEQGRQQGIEQGRQQGIQHGHTQGRRDMVQRQLGIKFGHLPASAVERLNAALPAELDAWAERLLTVSALKDVFGDPDWG